MGFDRRSFLQCSAAMAALAALGIRPDRVLAAEGGLLKVASDGDIQVLDPGYMIGGTDTSILFATMPRLAVPSLGDDGLWGWKPSDYVNHLEQTDDTHIAFTLKSGLQWTDGAGELTAEDVKFSFERMPASDWGNRWPTLDRVDVADKYSGTIVLKSPFVATWLLALASESGTIVPKAAVETLTDKKFTIPLPAQLGPYTMTEWVAKQRIVLKANESWPGTKPAFAEIQFINIEDSTARELAYEAKEVEMATITSQSAARFMKTPPAGARIISRPGLYYQYIGLNQDHEKLKDIRVRKAIQRAVDVPSILAAAYADLSPASTGNVPANVLGHREKAGYSYDPEAAKALLKEAGVKDLTLELRVLQNATNEAVAQIAQANLADVGITVDIVPLDSGPYWNLGLESKGDDWKKLQLTLIAYRTAPDPADALQWFTKNQVGVWNWERWSDPEFEDLWQKGLSERDSAKRGAIYARMTEIMENTGCYVWITYPSLFYIHRDNLVPALDPGGEMMVEDFKKA
jgi:peptide/nickel transport system substrate-binding protein